MQRRGFTLIEILIAMAVFLIGIVSILFLFPPGIKSSEVSTGQSVAAALAESLDDALTLALRQYDGVAGAAADPVHFYHDGLGTSGHATFNLPPLETWDGDPTGSGGTSTSNLANGRSTPTWYPGPNETVAPASLASITGGKAGNLAVLATNPDFPDPLNQYSFRFMCHEYKNPNDSNGPLNSVSEGTDEDPVTACSTDAGIFQFNYQNGAQAEVVDKLYQFTLYVYRGWIAEQDEVTPDSTFNVWAQTGASTGSQSTVTWQDQMKHSKKIERFEFTIYAQGARQP